MESTPEEFIFFLFIDLNEVCYPTYLPLKIIAEMKEIKYDEVLDKIEQEMSTNFLQDPESISRNDLQKMIRKYNPNYMWLVDEVDNLIEEGLECIFGDSVMCAEHYLMWRGKGLDEYLKIKEDVEELAKLYQCKVHEICQDQVDAFLTNLQNENTCRINNEVYLQKEKTSLEEIKMESNLEELWPEEDIEYKIELCETIQAEIDAENGENLWINYLNDKIKSNKRTKLQETKEKLVKENQENPNNFTDKFYMSKIINHKKILEQFKNNYNIYKLIELIRKKYDPNIYNKLCIMLKDKYINSNINRICSLIVQMIPLQIRTDPEIYEKIEILEIGYKINTWKNIWNELVNKINSKYDHDENIEIIIRGKDQIKQEKSAGRTKKKRKSFMFKKRIKPK